MKKLLILLIGILSFSFLNVQAEVESQNFLEVLKEENITLLDKEYEEKEENATIYLFWGNGCPHCSEFVEYLNNYAMENFDGFNLVAYEVWYNDDNAELFDGVAEYLGEDAEGVPFIVIGDDVWIGYSVNYNEEINTAINDLYDTPIANRYDVMENYEKDGKKTPPTPIPTDDLDPEEALREILSLFNDNNSDVYEYVDEDERALIEDFRKFMGDAHIDVVKVKNVRNLGDDNYKVTITFDANGERGASWNVSGFSADFYLHYDMKTQSFKLYNTNIFGKIGAENVGKFVGNVFVIIGIVMGAFLVLGTIVAVIIIVVVSNKKKQ